PLGYDRIKQAGAEHIGISSFWSKGAASERPVGWDPADPGDPHCNWNPVQHPVGNGVRDSPGRHVQIHQAPTWAERCNAPGEPGICNPNPTDFQQFTRAAATRYSGNFGALPRVRYWEPWNEPNLHIFFKPQRVDKKRPSPGLYRVL